MRYLVFGIVGNIFRIFTTAGYDDVIIFVGNAFCTIIVVFSFLNFL
jgi:hypothetical protein